MSYISSSHYLKWQYTIDKINNMRKGAIKRIPNKDNVYNITNDNDVNDNNDGDNNVIESWQNEEDIIILKRFCNIILDNFNSNTTIADVKLHWRVTSTAIVYFQRFYLNNNLLSHDPRLVMLTCIFLAGKVEECRLNLRSLIESVNVGNEADILAYELKLIEALDFDLKIHHPHGLMKTLVADIPTALEEMKKSHIINSNDFDNIIQSDTRRQWAINAEAIINKLYLSYALLCFNPMALVICALRSTEPVIIIDQYLEYRHGRMISSQLIEEAAKVDSFLKIAQAEEDQKSIKKYMKRLQSSSIWSSN